MSTLTERTVPAPEPTASLIPLVGGLLAVAAALCPNTRHVRGPGGAEDLALRVRHLPLRAARREALAELLHPAKEAVHGSALPFPGRRNHPMTAIVPILAAVAVATAPVQLGQSEGGRPIVAVRAGTRQDGRGVDLNANWSSGWHGGGRPWDVHYAGPRPFSERETRIGRDLILR